MTNKLRLTGIALTFGVAACTPAALIYSNFAPSNGYQTNIGHIIIQDPDVYFPQGERFSSGTTGAAQTLDIVMGHVAGNTMVSMGLFFDVGGSIFGQVGSLVNVTTQPGSFGYPNSYQSINVSSSGWNVISGANYWLVAFPSPNSNHAWNWNSTGTMGIHYAGGNYNPSVTQGVFRLSTVPEPSAVWGFALGMGLLVIRRSCNR